MRVLLVDDHAIFRQGLRALLETDDSIAEVVGEAEDGLEALDLTAELAPDVVIMDIYMPKLSGLKATKQIRERFSEIKVIILSSYADKVYVKEALKFGALGFVIKDAVFQELKVALNAVKNNKIYLSPGLLEPIVDHYMESPPVSKDLTAYNKLTIREKEIFKLFIHKCSRKEIAESLEISPKTVDTHRFNLMLKLNLDSDMEMIEFAKILKMEEA